MEKEPNLGRPCARSKCDGRARLSAFYLVLKKNSAFCSVYSLEAFLSIDGPMSKSIYSQALQMPHIHSGRRFGQWPVTKSWLSRTPQTETSQPQILFSACCVGYRRFHTRCTPSPPINFLWAGPLQGVREEVRLPVLGSFQPVSLFFGFSIFWIGFCLV